MDTHSTLIHDDTIDGDISETRVPPPKENFLFEMVRFAIIAVVIVFPIRLFIAQPFIVAGASMVPTFENGEYLIVDELTYRFNDPQRDDVIIFRYPRDPSKFFIKRIIGLPGEIVHIEGKTITIFNSEHKDGLTLVEPYVARMDDSVSLTQQLNEHEYFVLGDNRDASSDSRVWGVLERDLIVGRALLRLLPLTALEVFPGRVSSAVRGGGSTQ